MPLSKQAAEVRNKIVIPRLAINTKTKKQHPAEKGSYLLTPISPPTSSISSSYFSVGSTVSSSNFSFSEDDFEDTTPSLESFPSDFITAGEALMSILFSDKDKRSENITAFCQSLISTFAPGINVDMSSLISMIQPVNNFVSAEILDKHLFCVGSELHAHASFQHSKEIFGYENGSLSQGALDFIHEILFKLKAESAEDFLRLGLLYYDGKIIKRNYDLALSWFYRAQRAGNVEAMVYIGVCRLRGQGISRVN
jgi:hypothetical protein